MPSKPSRTLKRRLKASPAQVFSAWADPEKIVRWFGPAETSGSSVRAEMDVRAGGRYRISFKTGDEEYHEVCGVYREVVPDTPRHHLGLALHSERGSLLTVTVAKDGDGAMRSLQHEQFFDDKAGAGHKGGWTGTLDKLERYLTS